MQKASLEDMVTEKGLDFLHKAQIDFEPKVSIIIPVYNTDEYLRECLDSVVNQTLSEIEIICVDDGSTDSSLKILKEYAEKDKRINILQQNNSGAGRARNNGLRLATGEFLYFLDSDDYIKEATLETLYKKAIETDSDICLCRHVELNTQTQEFLDCPWSLREEILPKKESFSFKDMPENLLELCPPNLFIKLFRRSFIEEQGIFFQEIKTCNDVYFSFSSMLLAKKIATINEVFCIYRTRHNNLTKTRGEHAECILKAYQEIKTTLEKRGLFKQSEETFYKASIRNFTYEYWHCRQRKRFELLNLAKKFLPKSYFSILLEEISVKSYFKSFCGAIEFIRDDKKIAIKLYNSLILSIKKKEGN